MAKHKRKQAETGPQDAAPDAAAAPAPAAADGAQDSTPAEPESDVVDTADTAATADTAEAGLAALLTGHTPEELGARLLTAESQLAELQDGYVRARAEVENIQRRSRNEIIAARKFAVEGFARELLSVLDSLDQASKVELDEAAGEAVARMREGLALTLKQFEQALDKFGVAAVDAEPGGRFDPQCHQAVSMVPGPIWNRIISWR